MEYWCAGDVKAVSGLAGTGDLLCVTGKCNIVK